MAVKLDEASILWDACDRSCQLRPAEAELVYSVMYAVHLGTFEVLSFSGSCLV
jgi:hypothetical protein